MEHTEIEFKWEANQLGVFAHITKTSGRLGAQLERPQRWKITDVYMDTPDGAFEKEKIAFRVRCINGKWQATFKTRTHIIKGKAVRQEETLLLPRVTNLSQALQFLNRKKTWHGLCVANLTMLFKIENTRLTQQLRKDSMQAELAFDTCRLQVRGRRIYFKEVELELKKGSEAVLDNFARQLAQVCALRPARVSKVASAFALRALWEDR